MVDAAEGITGILVVDDEANVRAAVGRLLGREGFDVVQADDGRAAIDIVRATPGIALVLTDVVMPGVDGIALARALATSHPELPVVLMSGYTGYAADDVEALGLPLLLKPFSPAELLAIVRAQLARPLTGSESRTATPRS